MTSAATKMTVLAVALVSAFAVLSVYSDGSDADTADCTKYYYNQLDDIGKAIYDGACSMETGGDTFVVEMDMDWFTDKSKDGVESALQKSLKQIFSALMAERPDLYWIGNEIHYSYRASSLDGTITEVEATCTFTDAFDTTAAEKSLLSAAVDRISVDTASRYSAVESIHDAVVGMLTYDKSGDDMDREAEIRSAYTALAGDHGVVCEGYAKSFKLLCDKYDIPCITVTGDAKGAEESQGEGHMWNYVMMEDGKWYLVDCTWDDQDPAVDNYLLAGLSTVGITTEDGPAITISKSHSPNLTLEDGFTLPTLSDTAYVPGGTVTFSANGGDAVEPVTKNKGEKFTLPEPVFGTNTFAGWYTDSECTGTMYAAGAEYTVTGDATLYAKWDSLYTIYFAADGKTVGTVAFGSVTDTVTEPEVPARAEYTGTWESYTLALRNMTVNAVYTPIEYKIAFKADGNNAGERTVTVENISAGITEPAVPAKAGYDGVWEEYTLALGNMTVNAVYTPIEYTATFLADGTTLGTRTFTVEDSRISDEPSVPLKEYYFGSWSYTITADDITAEAVYTPVEYRIVFKADGNNAGERTVTVENISAGITEPAVPAKAGYTGAWESYTLALKNMTVNAVYTPIEYTATFIAEGITVGTCTFTMDDEKLDAPQVPAKEGYEGSWKYTIAPNDMTVYAVYTEEMEGILSALTENPMILGAAVLVIILIVAGIAVRHRH